MNGKSRNLVIAQSHGGWVSLVFCICCNPKEIGSNVSEGKDVLARKGQAGKDQNFPSSLSL